MKTLKTILVILGIYFVGNFFAGFIGEVCALGGMTTEAEALTKVVQISMMIWPIVIIICCIVAIKGLIGWIKGRA